MNILIIATVVLVVITVLAPKFVGNLIGITINLGIFLILTAVWVAAVATVIAFR